VELYNEVCEVFLGKRQMARGIDLDLTPAQVKGVLQPLALAMMNGRVRELPFDEIGSIVKNHLPMVSPDMTTKEFVTMVENRSGLSVERENGVWGFAHLTFQEYLAASELVENKLDGELLKRLADPWWHETTRLYAALGDGTRIVEACISADSPSAALLTLAVECVNEARFIEPLLRGKVSSLLDARLEDSDTERARLAAETKLELRIRRLTRVDASFYIDADLLSQAEYQLFVDDRDFDNGHRVPAHWQTRRFAPFTAREPVLGIGPSDAEAFCKWLSERRSAEWQYQIPDRVLLEQVTQPLGYWAKPSTGIEICGTFPSLVAPTEEMLRYRFGRDMQEGASALASAIADNDRLISLICDRARELANGVPGKLATALAIILDRTEEDRNAADRFLARDEKKDRRLDLTQSIVWGLNRALASNSRRESMSSLDGRLAGALRKKRRQILSQSSSPRLAGGSVITSISSVLDRALFRNLGLADHLQSNQQKLEHTFDYGSDPSSGDDRRLGRLQLRLLLLLCVDEVCTTESEKTFSFVVPGNKPFVNMFLDIYLALAFLEERVECRLPVFEGILLSRILKNQ
jgi:hypothetical protein